MNYRNGGLSYDNRSPGIHITGGGLPDSVEQTKMMLSDLLAKQPHGTSAGRGSKLYRVFPLWGGHRNPNLFSCKHKQAGQQTIRFGLGVGPGSIQLGHFDCECRAVSGEGRGLGQGSRGLERRYGVSSGRRTGVRRLVQTSSWQQEVSWLIGVYGGGECIMYRTNSAEDFACGDPAVGYQRHFFAQIW